MYSVVRIKMNSGMHFILYSTSMCIMPKRIE